MCLRIVLLFLFLENCDGFSDRSGDSSQLLFLGQVSALPLYEAQQAL